MHIAIADINGPAELILNQREERNESNRENEVESALEEKLRDEFNAATPTTDLFDHAMGRVMDSPLYTLGLLIDVDLHKEDAWLNVSRYIDALRTEYVNEHKYSDRAERMRCDIACQLYGDEE